MVYDGQVRYSPWFCMRLVYESSLEKSNSELARFSDRLTVILKISQSICTTIHQDPLEEEGAQGVVIRKHFIHRAHRTLHQVVQIVDVPRHHDGEIAEVLINTRLFRMSQNLLTRSP